MIIEKEELTIYEVEELHEELLRMYESGSVVIDFKNVHKIDMSIIQLLISAKDTCFKNSKEFKLLNVNEEISSVIKGCGCGFLLRNQE